MTIRALLLAVFTVLGCSSSPSRDGSVGDARVADGPRSERRGDGPRAEGGQGDGPVAPACAKGEWCWVNPLPHANSFNAISMSSSGAVFAVGDAGAAARFDGKGWTAMTTGSSYHLRGVWAFGPDEALAVGDGGTLLRFGAGKWSLEPAPGGSKVTLNAVWASGPKDIFVVGDKGTVLAYDGTWSVQTFPVTDKALTGVWGAGPGGDVYAVVGLGVYRLQRGGAWSLAATAPAGGASTCITRVAGGPFFVGTSYGTSETGGHIFRLEPPGALTDFSWPQDYTSPAAIWGRGPSEVYAVGSNGLYHFDGFQVTRTATISITDRLRGITGDKDALFLAGAGGAVLRVQGSALQKVLPAAAMTSASIRALAGRGASDVFAVGAGGTILHYDGNAWSKQASPTSDTLNGLWLGKGLAVAVGVGSSTVGIILHDTGSGWTSVASPVKVGLNAVWGSGPADVYAVGAPQTGASVPTILHYDGQTWATVALAEGGVSTLNGIWGSGPNNVYAVGSAGVLLRYDGSSWRKEPSPAGTTEPLNCVWGRSAGEVFIGGAFGTVFRFDGANWKGESASLGSGVNEIWGNGGTTFAVGRYGGIARNDGAGWFKMSSGCATDLHGLWGDGGRVWAAGDYGSLLRHDP